MQSKKLFAFWLPFLLFAGLIAFCIFAPRALSAVTDRAILNTLHQVPSNEPSGSVQTDTDFLGRFSLIHGYSDSEIIPLEKGKLFGISDAMALLRQELIALQQLQILPAGEIFIPNNAADEKSRSMAAEGGFSLTPQAYYHLRLSDPSVNAVSWTFEFALGDLSGFAHMDEDSGKIISVTLEGGIDPAAFSTYDYAARWIDYWEVSGSLLREHSDASQAAGDRPGSAPATFYQTFVQLGEDSAPVYLLIHATDDYLALDIIENIDRVYKFN